MISQEIAVNIKKATKKQKERIREILMAHYTAFVDSAINDSDFCSTTSAWKDYTPISKEILDPKEFIKRYETFV